MSEPKDHAAPPDTTPRPICGCVCHDDDENRTWCLSRGCCHAWTRGRRAGIEEAARAIDTSTQRVEDIPSFIVHPGESPFASVRRAYDRVRALARGGSK